MESSRTPPVLENVVADAYVLYGNDQRNILVTLAVQQVFRLRWTSEIEEEWVRNLSASKRGYDVRALRRTADLMREHVPTFDVPAYGDHLAKLTKTHAKDRHVAAAGIGCAPSTLVTWNLKDFDAQELAVHEVRLSDPDRFLSKCFDDASEFVHAATLDAYGFASGKTNKISWDAYLERIGTSGSPNCLAAFADRLRARTLKDQSQPENDATTWNHAVLRKWYDVYLKRWTVQR